MSSYLWLNPKLDSVSLSVVLNIEIFDSDLKHLHSEIRQNVGNVNFIVVIVLNAVRHNQS